MMGDITINALGGLLPELYLCGMAMLLLIYGVYRRPPAHVCMWFALIALGFTACMAINRHDGPQLFMNGMFALSGFTLFMKLLVLGASALVLALSSEWLSETSSPHRGEAGRGASARDVSASEHGRPHPNPPPAGEGKPFEFVILLLLSVLGMMLMISANDLLALYMALEMSSLALYVLASFNRDNAKSSEAGLKYFMLGALASGMMLFGMSLVYGFAGTIGFAQLAELFGSMEGAMSKGVVVGMVFIIVGFCFKLSAVPFHMWTPDVYEGAPTPVTAFFATAPKIAAIALFTRLLLGPFAELMAQWQQIIIAASLLSMIVGALAAIMQTNIKRLLAYSSIGHVGFMLMGMATGSQAGVQAMLIYLGVYIFMSAGMFGCVLMMKRGGQSVEEISDLSGLSRTHPAMAVAIAVFMFSMAGIPPLAGFFGKMYVVLAAIQAELIWLAVVGVLTSVIGCYYYLKVVKVMYFDEQTWGFDKLSARLLPAGVALCAGVTFLFFLLPMPLVAAAKTAAEALAK